MKLYLAGGKFKNQCMVGNGGKTERECSKKEPCPKVAKYNFKYGKRQVQFYVASCSSVKWYYNTVNDVYSGKPGQAPEVRYSGRFR